MQNIIKRFSVKLCASFILAGFAVQPALATSARLAPYTDNPLVEFLAQQRYHVKLATQFDMASNDHDPMTLIGGIGLFPTDQLAVGIYVSTRGSDRLYPYRMKAMRGLGLFAEYNFVPTARLQPFGGIRAGMLDTTGPGSPTAVHLAGLGGIKMVITPNLSISASGVLNWTSEDLLDYKQSDDGTFSASASDVGIEIGLRFGF